MYELDVLVFPCHLFTLSVLYSRRPLHSAGNKVKGGSVIVFVFLYVVHRNSETLEIAVSDTKRT